MGEFLRKQRWFFYALGVSGLLWGSSHFLSDWLEKRFVDERVGLMRDLSYRNMQQLARTYEKNFQSVERELYHQMEDLKRNGALSAKAVEKGWLALRFGDLSWQSDSLDVVDHSWERLSSMGLGFHLLKKDKLYYISTRRFLGRTVDRPLEFVVRSELIDKGIQLVDRLGSERVLLELNTLRSREHIDAELVSSAILGSTEIGKKAVSEFFLGLPQSARDVFEKEKNGSREWHHQGGWLVSWERLGFVDHSATVLVSMLKPERAAIAGALGLRAPIQVGVGVLCVMIFAMGFRLSREYRGSPMATKAAQVSRARMAAQTSRPSEAKSQRADQRNPDIEDTAALLRHQIDLVSAKVEQISRMRKAIDRSAPSHALHGIGADPRISAQDIDWEAMAELGVVVSAPSVKGVSARGLATRSSPKSFERVGFRQSVKSLAQASNETSFRMRSPYRLN